MHSSTVEKDFVAGFQANMFARFAQMGNVGAKRSAEQRDQLDLEEAEEEKKQPSQAKVVPPSDTDSEDEEEVAGKAPSKRRRLDEAVKGAPRVATRAQIAPKK